MGITVNIPPAPPPRSPPLAQQPLPTAAAPASRWPLPHILLILGLWLAIFAASLAKPPLLDDADSTHAQAAQAMLRTGDLVTLHVDGVRYLEKPPLPYWIAALSLRLFAHRGIGDSSRDAFAIHLPLALTVLGLALLGYAWSRRAFDLPFASQREAPAFAIQHTALYTALFTLTSTGVFLFTRVFIPDALLSLLLAFTLYAMLRALEPPATSGAPLMRGRSAHEWGATWAYAMWTALALAVLTKGLVALIFIFGAAAIFLFCTGELRNPRAIHRLRPFTGLLLFLAIAAPWHILAGLRNTGGANGHGFFWFYFVNEHFLRFLGRRIPRDYNKLPSYLYWSLHIVWLFPWSLFAPAAILYAWRQRRERQALRDRNSSGDLLSRFELLKTRKAARTHISFTSFTERTVLLLSIFSALVLVFFSLSTNQEYYTFPVYLPLLMLLAAALTGIERTWQSPLHPGAPCPDSGTWVHETSNTPGAPFIAQPLARWVGGTASAAPGAPHPATRFANSGPPYRRTLTFAFAALTVLGLAIAAALAYGLWSARHLPFVPDIGSLLAHRDVGDYTLSMSHFFDLTGPSFAALRLPATLAAAAFLLGPAIAWLLYKRQPARRNPHASLLAPILAIALTATVFLIAAHIALVRFAPMLSSESFATTIQSLERGGRISPDNQVLIYGDQAFGSSIPFYLDRRVYLVDGRTTSMLFGSTFPDAPPIFLTHQQLLAQWGHGPRKLLFVPLEQRAAVDRLLGPRQIILQETSGKALITDRPLKNQGAGNRE